MFCSVSRGLFSKKKKSISHRLQCDIDPGRITLEGFLETPHYFVAFKCKKILFHTQSTSFDLLWSLKIKTVHLIYFFMLMDDNKLLQLLLVLIKRFIRRIDLFFSLAQWTVSHFPMEMPLLLFRQTLLNSLKTINTIL